jgi:hypothetical protein
MARIPREPPAAHFMRDIAKLPCNLWADFAILNFTMAKSRIAGSAQPTPD